jgi:uncharacterized protein (DUF1330 family)
VSIAKNYSRASQPFLFARLTQATHDLKSAGRWCSASGEWEDIMKTRYTVVLSMIAGAAVGAAAIQGLHAQAKPKVYFISESEVLDRAAVDAYNSQVQQAIKAAGGNLVIGEKIVAVLGDPPKRVGVTEFESLDKAQAWINSPERKGLAPQREKAVKFIRQYIVEGK